MVEPELAIMYGSQLPEIPSLKQLRMLRRNWQHQEKKPIQLNTKMLLDIISVQRQEIANLREENEWLKRNPNVIYNETINILAEMSGLPANQLSEFIRTIEELKQKEASVKPAVITAASTLPDELCTPAAMRVWKALQDAGYIGPDYQPATSRPIAALVAELMCDELGIFNKWQIFEAFWKRNNMYNDLYELRNQKKFHPLKDKIYAMIKEAAHPQP